MAPPPPQTGRPIRLIIGYVAVTVAAAELYEWLSAAAADEITSAAQLSAQLSAILGQPVEVPAASWAILVDDYGEYFEQLLGVLDPWQALADWIGSLFR